MAILVGFKVSDLKGPMVITNVNGVEFRHQVIADSDKEQQPQFYSVINYGTSQDLKSEEEQKLINDINERHEKMREDMYNMRKRMLERFAFRNFFQ